VQKAALEQQHRIAPVEDGARDGRTLVSNGAPLLDTRVAIVDPATGTRCAPDGVGEIWVASPSVAQGYWNRPQETRDTFQARLAPHGDGPFLRTGDLGFLKDGQLFVTGRLKDLIIIRGNNHYPQDIERTVQQSHAALRPDCGAAFSIDIDGEERLIVVQEVERQTEATQAELVKAIRWAVAEEHEVQVHDVALIRAGTIAKTSSGKIQRRACREAYMSGALKLTSGERDEL
jgi:acyl-CoA synthetase (AMP-forming)/AMP-acid ligase II